MGDIHNDVKDVNGHKNNSLSAIDSAEAEDHTDGEDCSESTVLLVPKRGGMSRKSDNTKRKVQWNDRNGNKLVEIIEFEPSLLTEESFTEKPKKKSCVC
ncbi:Actin-related protein 2/3 complex subunit 2 [Hibiscus syriacus]|uniref:Actin-related protein 2/3 complex subunit 2 n=1 Tax=Hibiscus syriacus TaxID=106335 RepID=A0A6A3D6U2_HIBSY|nr:Actin-related protein 2/3 complex subunit 2 [Hibiscus syriacus]